MAEVLMVCERDVFCRTCRKVIERETRNVKYLDYDQVTAMLCGPALRDHREEDNCPGDTWDPGPWSEPRKA